MSDSELNATLKAIGRGPEIFRRDTPMLLKTLKNIEAINREMKTVEQQFAIDTGADIVDTLRDDEK